MWMKLFQLVCAFAGGSFMIYVGVENGPAIGLVAVTTAYLMTLLAIGAANLWQRIKPKQSLNRNL